MKAITHSADSKIDLNLESLRGYSALFVVLSHVINFSQYLDPNYFPKCLKFFTLPGHLCVLIFFLLSGYVISLRHNGEKKLTRSNSLNYLTKRFIRLYPIYFFCIILSLIVATVKYDFVTVLSNLIFTQNISSDCIWEINPIWSLNYEVIFYLAFIPISIFSLKPIRLIIIAAVIVSLFYLLNISSLSIIPSYLIGFVFWISGLIIAVYLEENTSKVDKNLLLSNLFLLLSIGILFDNAINFIFMNSKFKIIEEFPGGLKVRVRDFFFLPYCFVIVANFTNRSFSKRKIVLTILQVLPVLTFYPIYVLIKEKHFTVIFGILNYIISTILFFGTFELCNKFLSKIIKIGTWLGGVSYSIYLLHFPLLVLFGRINFFSGTIIFYSIRFFFFFFSLFSLAIFLEHKFQPFVKKVIQRRA